MNLDNLKLLRQPFPAHQISRLPKGTKAQNECDKSLKRNCKICGGWHHPDIIHLDYVGHAALTDRLLDADPLWTWEPLAYKDGLPAFDTSGGLWIKLTVCGHTRIGYGHAAPSSSKDIGSREKEVIGDALRNAAMRFGAALDLWHKGELHIDEEAPKITPTAGAKERVDTLERRALVEKTASAMMDWLNQGAVDDAVLTAENAGLDPEEKVYLWTFFDSKQRSSMKKSYSTMNSKSTQA